MASEPNNANQDRPPANTRMHSGLENLLPASITKRSRSRSRTRPSATSQLERSISSMTDSFMLEQLASSSLSTHSGSNTRSSSRQPSQKEDRLTPISNWAHLSYIKNQRNALRGEVKAHQVADAEARKSLASLRQLTFRMAVNATVKEKRIATTAKNLVKSRKSHYLEGRDAEKRIENLKRALRVEEGRNQEVLGALERASTLTLQYSTPAQQSPLFSPLSPPPSPPTRVSSPSRWNNITPGIAAVLQTPGEVHTSDVRLMRAKRESVQALIACRSRIEELQAECTKRRDDGILMDKTRETLEFELQSHQARIAALEQSRSALNETLEATKSHLDTARCSEQNLEQELRMKSVEIADMEHGILEKHQIIQNAQHEKELLEKTLQARDFDLKELNVTASARENTLRGLQHKVKDAERLEASLRGSLQEKEHAQDDMRKQLDEGSQHLNDVQQQLIKLEAEAAEQSSKIKVSDNAVSELREQLDQSVNERVIAESLMSTMKTENTLLTTNLQREKDACDELVKELNSMKAAQEGTQHDLLFTKESLYRETEAKNHLLNELESLQSSRNALKLDFQAALENIRSLEGNAARTRSQLESVRDGKAALDADLRHAREEGFQHREKLTMCNVELKAVNASKIEIEHRLRESERNTSILAEKLDQARNEGVQTGKQLKVKAQKLSDMERSIKLSQSLQASLREELNQVQRAKDAAEQQRSKILSAKSELEREIGGIQAKLERTQHEREKLQAKAEQFEQDLGREKREKQDLEGRLGAVQTEVNGLEDLVSGLKASLQVSQDAAAEFEEALRVVHMEKDTAYEKMNRLQDQLKEAKDRKGDAEERYRNAMDEGLSLRKQISTLHSTLAKTESKLSVIQSQFSTSQSQKTEARQSEREAKEGSTSAQEAYDKLMQESSHTRSQLQALETEYEQLMSTLSMTDEELMALHRSKAEVDKQLKVTTDINTRLETQVTVLSQHKMNAESRLHGALLSNAQLKDNLSRSQSQVHEVNKHNVNLSSTLLDTKAALESFSDLQADLEDRLEKSVSEFANLNKHLELNRSELSDALSRNVSLNAKILETKTQLGAAQDRKAKIEERLAHMEGQHTDFANDLSNTQSTLRAVETEKADLSNQLVEANIQVEKWQSRNTQLEKRSEAVSQHAGDLENDFRTARMQLEISESESLALLLLNKQLQDQSHSTSQRTSELERELHTIQVQLRDSESDSAILGSKAIAADQKLDSLRTKNADLELRLASAEHDLDNVREMNAHLETFLDQIEKDMATAETAVEESESRLEEFVRESQAKLDAAKTSKLKYKARLLVSNVEIKSLINENDGLRHTIGEQLLELEARERKEERVESLERTEGVVDDEASSDQEEEFFDCTDYELGNVEEEQVKPEEAQSNQNAVKDVEADLQADGISLSPPSLASVEHKLPAEETEDKAPKSEFTLPTSNTVISSTPPSNLHPTIPQTPTPSPPLPISRPTNLDNRPSTHAGTPSSPSPEQLGTWTTEFDRIRNLRNAQSAHLKALKRERHDLKKSLKESDHHLHELEKRATPKRRRTLLHKRRPDDLPSPANAHVHGQKGEKGEKGDMLSDPNMSERPATSGGHSLLMGWTGGSTRLNTPGPGERPKSSLMTDSRPWSMFSFASTVGAGMDKEKEKRPGTGYSSVFGTRPATSGSRPVTSAGLVGGALMGGEREGGGLMKGQMRAGKTDKKRVWSIGLRNLFKKEKLELK